MLYGEVTPPECSPYTFLTAPANSRGSAAGVEWVGCSMVDVMAQLWKGGTEGQQAAAASPPLPACLPPLHLVSLTHPRPPSSAGRS